MYSRNRVKMHSKYTIFPEVFWSRSRRRGMEIPYYFKVITIDSGIKQNIFRRFRFVTKFFIPLFVFGTCGIAGVLPDFDHLTKVIYDGLPVIQENLTGRTWHVQYFILFGIIWLCSLSYVYRLYWVVLKSE